MTKSGATLSEEEMAVRVLVELERRKALDPPAFYEPASDKIESFHRSQAQVRALFGANRSSKTESALEEVIYHLRGDHPYQPVKKGPVYWRIVVPDFGQVEKVVNDKLRRMMPPSLLRGGTWEKAFDNRSHILYCSNGSKVDIMTHVQPVVSFEGASRDGTLFDEEPPYDIYVSCIMRHIDVRGRTIMAMTPLNGLTYTYDEIYLKSFSNPNIQSWTLSTYENRYLTQEAIDEIEALVTDPIDREIRLYGKFRSKTGLVFKSFTPDVHIYQQPTKESDWLYEYWDGEYPPSHWFNFVGIDPGWDHPTGIVWLAIDPDSLDYYFYREHKESNQDPAYHANIIKAYNHEMGIKNPIYVIDSQANATHQDGTKLIEDYQDQGIWPRRGTKKLFDGNLYLSQLMKVVEDNRERQHTRFHVSSECPELIQEIGKYQRAKTTDLNNAERFQDKFNDLISAARYAAWEGKRNEDDLTAHLEERDLWRSNDTDVEKRKGFARTGY